MLKKETIQQIESLLKVSGLVAAFEAEAETDVAIPDGLQVVTPEDLTRIKNAEYTRGKDNGVEMAVKEVKDKMKLDFTGKTVEGLVNAAQTKAVADANIAPNEQVKQLQADVQTLRDTNTDLTTKLTAQQSTAARAETERDIYQQIPSLGEGAMPMSKVLTLMRADGYDFRKEGNELVAVKGQDIVKDNLAKVVPVKDVISNYAKENNIISAAPPPARGRGAGDAPPSNMYTKLSEVEQSFKDQGKSTLGEEFTKKVNELATANPDFDMNN